MAVGTIAELLDTPRPVVAPPVEAPRPVVAPPVEPVHPEANIQHIPQVTVQWLPAVPTSSAALADPRGWYQRTLASEAVTSGVKVMQLATDSLSAAERGELQAFSRHTLQRSMARVRPLALPADSYTWAAPTWSALVKADQRVVAHVGVMYRVVQVGQVRVPVGGIGGVMTLPEWRRRGYARAALATATAFVAQQLWAPFALVLCAREEAAFYEHLGWHVAQAPIGCEQPQGQVRLDGEVGLVMACQGEAEWPGGPIDLLGTPW